MYKTDSMKIAWFKVFLFISFTSNIAFAGPMFGGHSFYNWGPTYSGGGGFAGHPGGGGGGMMGMTPEQINQAMPARARGQQQQQAPARQQAPIRQQAAAPVRQRPPSPVYVIPPPSPPFRRAPSRHNDERFERLRDVCFDPDTMAERREQAIRNVVAAGNPCQGCTDADCNEKYLKTKLAEICDNNPRCACFNAGACDQSLIESYRDQFLYDMPEHFQLEPGQRHRTPSPSLRSVYPELVLLPVARRVVNIGRRLIDVSRQVYDLTHQTTTQAIETPYGSAEQELDREALEVRQQVEDGAILYRLGTLGRNETGDRAQFWSLEHPNTPGYGYRHAMPQANFERADFIERARMLPGSDYVTRKIAPLEDPRTLEILPGGGYEIVIPSNEGSVATDSFTTF